MGKQVTFDVLARAKATGFNETDARLAKTAAAAKKAAKDTHLLSTAITTGVAASIPIVGAAAGAMVGLGGAAGVAVVGVLGIRDAMQQGTVLGKQYQAAFKPITAEFQNLKQIGAQGMFAGINSGVKSLKPLFPALNKDVALLSTQLGKVAGNVGPGLVSLFTRLNPLFATVGDQLVHGSQGFEQWAKSSQSVGRFVAYVQTTLPQVEQTIGSLATTIAHIAVAAEPFGGTTLTAIRLFSQAINLIPIGVLQTVVPLLLGLKVGSTLSASIGNASTGIEKFATKLGKSTGAASEASGVVGKLGKAVGFLGPVGIAAGVGMGVLSAALGHGKQAAIEQTNRINDLTAAIQNNKVAQTLLTQLQQQGAVQAANSLGISQRQLLDSLTGSSTKFNALSAQLKQQGDEYDRLALIKKKFLTQGAQEPNLTAAQQKQYDQLGSSLPKLSKALSNEWDAYQKAKAAAADMAKQMGDTALAAQIQNGAVDQTAKSLGTTAGAYTSAKLAADQQAQSTMQATLQMQLANDAAGLLKQSLDLLNGKAISAADAQNAFDSSLVNMGNHVTATGKKVKFTTTNIHDMSSASVALRGELNGQVTNLQNVIAANGGLSNSTSKAKAQMAALRQQIINNAVAHGVDRGAVTSYIDSLLKIPKTVPRTKFDVDTSKARAAVAALAAYISSFRPIMEASVHIAGAPAAGGHLAVRATGGPVAGGKQYLVNELGQELFVPNNAGAYLIPGGPHMWKAPATGQIINAATVRGLRNKLGKVANASLAKLPGAASSAVNAVANILPYGSAVTRQLQSEDTQLERTAAKRATVISKLQAGYKRLAAAQKAYSDEVVKVRDAVVGSFDVANAGKDAFGDTHASGIINDLQTQVQQANRFASDIAKLKGKLNAAQLQKLAEGGLSSLPTLDALAAATPAQLKQFNALMTQLNAAGVKAGHAEADSLYLAGINSAKGLIKGLQSQENALTKQMQRMAKILVNSLKKALGIHSPATELQMPGRNTVLGFVKGIDSGTAHVVAAAARMGGAAVPSLSATSNSSGGGTSSGPTSSGGDTYYLHFHGAVIGRMDQAAEDFAQALERRSIRGKVLHVKTG